MILWMFEDLDTGKCDVLSREKGRTPLAKGKRQEHMVQSHQDKRTRRRSKTGVGIAGKQVINRRIAWQGHSSNRVKDNRVLVERETIRMASQAKGEGKKGKSKDVGALVWNQQTGSPVASSVASSAPQTDTSTTVGTIDTIECTGLDSCATTMAQHEVVDPRWIAFNVDTGAGGTVWPMNADYVCEKVSGPAGRNNKTATGVMVEVQGLFRVRCQSVWGHQLHMIGKKTSVHKPLLSVETCQTKVTRFDGNVGYIIQKDSPILTVMRMCFEKACEQHLWNGAIDLTKELGVYNLYVQLAGGEGNVERAVDVSPNELEFEVERGGLRQVNP